MTIRSVKLRYLIVNLGGLLDAHSGRLQLPIHENMQRYPTFFGKKRKALHKEVSTLVLVLFEWYKVW